MSKARLSQIMGLLNLAPTIQEEILLTDSPKIYQLSVDKIQQIALEIAWKEQLILWANVTAPIVLNSFLEQTHLVFFNKN